MEVWNDADVFQGRAWQDAWFEHLKESIGNKFEVERGKRKKGSDPDRLSPEDYALQQEQERLQAELKRQLDPTTPQEASESSYGEQVAQMVADAREEVVRANQEAAKAIRERAQKDAASVVLGARESAEADVRAITHSMLKNDGKEFMETKEENRLLHKKVKQQEAMINLLQSVLKQLVPAALRKRIQGAYDTLWRSHSENPDKPKEQHSQGNSDRRLSL